jgi:hypothetical protein
MPSRFHPIEDGLWDDPKFDATATRPEAPGEERGFFAFLSSNKMQRSAGIYRATDEELSAAARIPIKRVRFYLADLQSRDLIVRDGLWIFCQGYWKRQAHNPGFVKSARLCVVSCSSIAVQASFIKHYPLHREWLPNGWPTVDQPSSEIAPTEAVTEEQHNSNRACNTSRSLPERADWPSPEALALKYNAETTDNCPAVTRIPEGSALRQRACAYLRMFPDEEWWTVTFSQYAASRFLSGKSVNGDGHKSFKPDLAWLLSKGKDGVENCVKTHDGRYRDGT